MKQPIIFCMVLSLMFSCKNNSGLNGPLTIKSVNKIRHQEVLGNAEVSIRFDEVTEDSRCPANANCVWEGNAKIKFTFFLISEKQVIPFEIYATEIPQLQIKNDTIISDYRVEMISLEPYPETSDEIPQASYTAEIRVEKKNSLSQNLN